LKKSVERHKKNTFEKQKQRPDEKRCSKKNYDEICGAYEKLVCRAVFKTVFSKDFLFATMPN